MSNTRMTVTELQEAARRVGLDKVAKTQPNILNNILGWWMKLKKTNPDAANALIRGLIGAGVGGIAGGGMGAATRGQGERGGVLGPALLGALLAGGGTAAVSYGSKLYGGRKPKKSLAGGIISGLAYPVTKGGILPVAGGIYGGWKGLLKGKYGYPTNKSKPFATGAREAIGKAWRGALPSSKARQLKLDSLFTQPAGKRILKPLRPLGRFAARGLRAVKNMPPRGRLGLAGIPLGILAGWIIKKQLAGET